MNNQAATQISNEYNYDGNEIDSFCTERIKMAERVFVNTQEVFYAIDIYRSVIFSAKNPMDYIKAAVSILKTLKNRNWAIDIIKTAIKNNSEKQFLLKVLIELSPILSFGSGISIGNISDLKCDELYDLVNYIMDNYLD
ncbi:MAG: hypothetical protein JXR48_06900 [Candidatus Delongbacteria bacterium]|nr:hypothetical protein [Candidatus Delongbacteria bacterium]MBN2834679.1 hypothetical protein [Candidatus Delongbacteria bacterium]